MAALHESIRTLVRSIVTNEDETSNRVRVGNRMILNSIEPNDEYRQLISDMYESGIASVYESPESRHWVVEDTNNWIRRLTNDKIDSIIDDDTLSQTSIALINAVYFKQAWDLEFDEAKTRKYMFQVNRESKAEVDMMQLADTNLGYHQSDVLNAHLLSLPYKEDKFRFNIVFPVDDDDFLASNDENSLIRRLNSDLLKSEMAQIFKQKVNLQMPKFTSEKKIKVNSGF